MIANADHREYSGRRMAQRCGVCAHPMRAEVDALLRGEHNLSSVARDLDLTRYAVMRHREHHLAGRKSPQMGDATGPQTGDSAELDETVRTPPPQLVPPKDQPGQQTAFLTAYAARCDVAQGLKAAGITRARLRQWQEHDADFALRFRQA